jgi:nitroreductase
MAVELCAGVAGIEALKLLTGRGKVRAAPWYHQFDAFAGRWVSKRAWFGHRNPLFRLKCRIARRVLTAYERGAGPHDVSEARTDLERIVELARWAPTGDNQQPWRFELREPEGLVIHLRGNSSDIYDTDGRATLLSGGCLLATLEVAAARFSRMLRWTYRGGRGPEHTIEVEFVPAQEGVHNSGESAVLARSVDRRPFLARALTQPEKQALQAALGPAFDVRWFERSAERLRMAWINARAAKVRLLSREAFEVQRRVIDFDCAFSADRIPAVSLGMSSLSLALMRWGMKSFSRMRWLLALGGRLTSHLELDLIPGVACAAHFALIWREPPTPGPEADIAAGQAFQRFWLEATRLALVLQPGYAPLALARMAHGERSGKDTRLAALSERSARLLTAVFPVTPLGSLCMLGRIGAPRAGAPQGRSWRLPLHTLLQAHER